ncbi:MAG: hypothetical protein LBT69_04495 [Lactobacillales bacterium]|jgi:hypothetical protein|nr:hypothetical protein [Lactobacillales bacterium]
MKTKFELTPDLIKIEKEPPSDSKILCENQLSPPPQEKILQKAAEFKEQLNLKITTKTKKEFKLWCIKNATNMTDAIELAIKELIKK